MHVQIKLFAIISRYNKNCDDDDDDNVDVAESSLSSEHDVYDHKCVWVVCCEYVRARVLERGGYGEEREMTSNHRHSAI